MSSQDIIKVRQLNAVIDSDMYGKWYVCMDGPDYDKYLHTDGVWRCSTVKPGCKAPRTREDYTGYFDTKEDAEAALGQ